MAQRKKFIDVELPLLGISIPVLGTPESLQNRTIKMDLTRKLRGKSLEVIFQIYNKEELYGLPKSLNLMKFYIRRMMRKRASYVEDSFQTKCKDVEVTIKPFLITRKRVSRAVRNNLRKTAKEFLINYIKEKDYLAVCEDILSNQLQKEMLPKLKKVYPLSFCEIRVFETKEMNKVAFTKVKKEVKKETPKQMSDEEKIEDIIQANLEDKEETKKEEVLESKETSEEKPKVKKEKKAKKDSKTEKE